MANPEDPGTGGRGPRPNRWGRRQEGPADAQAASPADGGEEAAGPIVSEGSDPSTVSGGKPAAAGAGETQADGTPQATRPGPRLEYARPEQTLATLRALGLPLSEPMPVTAPEAARSEAEAEQQAGVLLELPAYVPVDRAIPPEVFSLDILVRNPDTQQVDFVVRRSYGYPSGQLPAQPGRIPTGLDPRTAVCRSLSPRAAARCLRQGGSF